MTAEEFDAACRKMTKGVTVPSRLLDGMTNDLAKGLDSCGVIDSWSIVKTGQRSRMLVAKGESQLQPDEVLAKILAAYEKDVRYSGESITTSDVDGGTLVFRFCTRSNPHIVVSGEIIVKCAAGNRES